MNKDILFHKGDVLEVCDGPEIRHWHNGKHVVGVRFRLTEEEADKLNRGMNIHPEDNKYSINFNRKMFVRINSPDMTNMTLEEVIKYVCLELGGK